MFARRTRFPDKNSGEGVLGYDAPLLGERQPPVAVLVNDTLVDGRTVVDPRAGAMMTVNMKMHGGAFRALLLRLLGASVRLATPGAGHAAGRHRHRHDIDAHRATEVPKCTDPQYPDDCLNTTMGSCCTKACSDGSCDCYGPCDPGCDCWTCYCHSPS